MMTTAEARYGVWRKPGTSPGPNTCVDVNPQPDGWVHVRDSKLGDASDVLRFDPEEWAAFIESARRGEYTFPVPASV